MHVCTHKATIREQFLFNIYIINLSLIIYHLLVHIVAALKFRGRYETYGRFITVTTVSDKRY